MKTIVLPTVVAVHKNADHGIAKIPCPTITVITGLGVDGDAHHGATVQHRYLARRKPDAPNLRQVHLIEAEFYADLVAQGFPVVHGQMGENITTTNINLCSLPKGTKLQIGPRAELDVSGLRHPCDQLEAIQPGLLAASVTMHGPHRGTFQHAIMCTVTHDGPISPGDTIRITRPPEPYEDLQAV